MKLRLVFKTDCRLNGYFKGYIIDKLRLYAKFQSCLYFLLNLGLVLLFLCKNAGVLFVKITVNILFS